MSYPKLGIYKFGRQLIETGDLDPVYILLYKAELPSARLYRLLLAYWLYYHLGVACHLSKRSGKAFYREALRLAKPGSKTPRGTERRHFRGEAALKCIKWFEKKYPKPEDAVAHLIRQGKNTTLSLSLQLTNRWPLFGPWIGFKVADMLSVLELSNIQFPIENLIMYSEPVKGAEMYAKRMSKKKGWGLMPVESVVYRLQAHFQMFKAPPAYNRRVGVQEVETILCKWKSHRNGHYPVGKDTKEIKEGLKGWGKLAEKLRGIKIP